MGSCLLALIPTSIGGIRDLVSHLRGYVSGPLWPRASDWKAGQWLTSPRLPSLLGGRESLLLTALLPSPSSQPAPGLYISPASKSHALYGLSLNLKEDIRALVWGFPALTRDGVIHWALAVSFAAPTPRVGSGSGHGPGSQQGVPTQYRSDPYISFSSWTFVSVSLHLYWNLYHIFLPFWIPEWDTEVLQASSLPSRHWPVLDRLNSSVVVFLLTFKPCP